MEYGGNGIYNRRGKAIRVEGDVSTDTARVDNSRRKKGLTSQAKRFSTFSIGPYRKRSRGR